MKQHITIEQLDSLSKEGKKKLRKWWKPKDGDWVSLNSKKYLLADCCSLSVKTWGEIKDKWDKGMSGFILTRMNDEYGDYFDIHKRNTILPLLSIGQMIEFLNEHSGQFIMSEMGQWGSDYFDFDWTGELCDKLWEAVKEVLNEKNRKPSN